MTPARQGNKYQRYTVISHMRMLHSL